MLTPAMKTFRLSKMTTAHVTVQGALSSTGKTVAQIAAACGITQDEAEKKLSALIDEALASRTVGGRSTALYTAL
jgi:hypothetical protein